MLSGCNGLENRVVDLRVAQEGVEHEEEPPA